MNSNELKLEVIENIDKKLQMTFAKTHEIIDAVTDITLCIQEVLFFKNLLTKIEEKEQK